MESDTIPVQRVTRHSNNDTSDVYPCFEDILGSDGELCETLSTAEALLTVAAQGNGDLRPSRIRRIFRDEEIDLLNTRSFSDNTKKKMKWAIALFSKWKLQRNYLASFDNTISKIDPEFLKMTKDELNFCISRFICEINKDNGEEYPAQTLHELVIMLQFYLHSNGKLYKLLNEDCFIQIKNTLDHAMKERTASGIGTEKRQADVITVQEENKMWEDGVLDSDTPRRLLDTLIYLIGINYAFRGGMEHRNLRFVNSQLTLVATENGGEALRYREQISKTNQGGLASRKLKQKIVFAFPNTQHPERCLLRYYKLYLEHCPEEKPENCFYLRPLQSPKGSVWFASSPVGKNHLLGAVSRLCKQAGLSGNRTNHSLRATAATRLYEAGCEEQLVSEVTGHRSDAVREYKRTNEQMKRRMNNIIHASESALGDSQPEVKIARGDSGPSEHAGDPSNIVRIIINVNVNK